jgi:hypothetical protein
MRATIAALIAAGAAATAAAPAAAAAPANGLDKQTFKVTVEGVQRTTWNTNHTGTGGCDGSVTGSGSETVRFASRPVRAQATVLRGLRTPVLSVPGRGVEPTLRLSGTVARKGTIVAAEGPCGGAGGGSIPRDCGTKSFRGVKLPVAYRLPAKPDDQLELRPEVIADPFKNCPSGGRSFPSLVGTDADREMLTELPREELFDRSLGKIIVIARGKESQTAGEDTYLTTTRWVVSFERLGTRRSR